VWVDDTINAGQVEWYTFYDVVGNHTITAEYSTTPVNNHTITATVLSPEGHEGEGEPDTYGGSISPGGEIGVREEDDITFLITAEPGWHIAEVIVDNRPVAVHDFYTFARVRDNHEIQVRFAEGPEPDTHLVTAGTKGSEENPGKGTISPWGEVPVADGADATFAITPDQDSYLVAVWIDDSINAGQVDWYTFYDITENHTITAEFSTEPVHNHTITATVLDPEGSDAGHETAPGGSITPEGDVGVRQGDDITFKIIPDTDWYIAEVLVDGHSVGVPEDYTFHDVQKDYDLDVRFTREAPAIHTITSSVVLHNGAEGHIAPWGEIGVVSGTHARFDMTPGDDSHISAVYVDGDYVGQASHYEFRYVDRPHEIVVHYDTTDPATHTITASTSSHGENPGTGHIAPNGEIPVVDDSDVHFAITPDEGSHIHEVLVDGRNVGIVEEYIFRHVDQDHTIEAIFRDDAPAVHTITATVNPEGSGNGFISPPGEVEVAAGSDMTFYFTPQPGHHIHEIRVNGELQAIAPFYTFTDVQDNHDIEVTFSDVPNITLTLLIEGEGKIGIDGQAYTAPSQVVVTDLGNTLTLEAEAVEGWHFVGWENDLDGNNTPQNILMSEDKEVTARFVPELSLVVEDTARAYGDPDPVFNLMDFSDQLLEGHIPEDVLGSTVSYTLSSTDITSAVGVYEEEIGLLTSTIDGPHRDDYHINVVSGTLEILPRAIQVTALDAEKMEDEPDPEFEWQITQGELLFEDSITGNMAREPGDAVGDYPIRQGGLTAGDNYDIDFVEGTLTILPMELDSWTWTGDESDDWYSGANWDAGITPEEEAVIVIPDGRPHYPVVRVNGVNPAEMTVIKDVLIDEDAHMVIDPGKTIEVVGELTNLRGHEGLVIRSDETGQGGLLHYQDHVYATVERYVGGEAWAWHQLAGPVAGQMFTHEFTSGGSLFAWSEPAQRWVSHGTDRWEALIDDTGEFIPGSGYLTAYRSNPTLAFEGELIQGEVEIPLNRKAEPDHRYVGYNLIGNPYPSAIDWRAETGWQRDNLVTNGMGGYNMWIWNDEEGNYGAYGAHDSAAENDYEHLGVTRYIAPSQSFWVRAATDEAVIRMDNDVRVSHHQQWLKKQQSAEPGWWLKAAVSSDVNGYRDEVVLDFGLANDNGGVEKMFSMYAEAPSLYTVKNGEKLSISYLTTPEDHPQVPLSFVAGEEGTYQINLEGTYMFDEVWLEDLQTGEMADMKAQDSYSFEAGPDDDPDRFVLHFGYDDPTDIMPRPEDRIDPVIYYHEERLHIYNPWPELATVEVTDVNGRLVRLFEAPGPGDSDFAFSVEPGVYVVRMYTGEELFTTRIMVAR
ncbi:MAG: MBG domain-containing protein, partial [Bacteroidales bacterium]